MSIVISLPAPLWGCSPFTSIPVRIIYSWLCIMLKGFCRGEVVRCTPMQVVPSCELHTGVYGQVMVLQCSMRAGANWGHVQAFIPFFPGSGLSFMFPADPGSQCPAFLIVYPTSFPSLPAGPWQSLPVKTRLLCWLIFLF